MRIPGMEELMKQEVHLYIQMKGRWLLIRSQMSDRWEVIHTQLAEGEDILAAAARAVGDLFQEKVTPYYISLTGIDAKLEARTAVLFVRIDPKERVKEEKDIYTISTENLIENIKHLNGYGTEYKEMVIQSVKDEAKRGYF